MTGARLRLAFVFVLFALSAGHVAGCGLLPIEDKPRDRGVDAGRTFDTPWHLTEPSQRRYAPGEWLSVTVANLRRADGAPVLWIGEAGEPRVVFPVAQRVDDGTGGADAGAILLPDGATGLPDAGMPDAGTEDEPAEYRLEIPLPLWTPGVYEVGVGNVDELRTHTFEIEIVLPERQMSQADAAALLRDGLRAVVADARGILEEPDAEWQAVLGSGLDGAERAEMMEAFAALEAVADEAAAEYMRAADEEEQALQSALHASGFFASLEGALEGDPPSTLRWRTLPPRLEAAIHQPLQALLYALDLTDALLTTLGLVIDVVEIGSALVGAFPATAACFGAKMVLAGTRAIIENFVPTDLLEITAQGQRRLFHGEGAIFLHWGRFGSQNAGGSILRSIEDLVLTGIAEALPGPDGVSRGAKDFLRDVLTYFAMRIPGAAIQQGIGGDVRFSQLLVPLDMGAYSYRLSEALALLPIGGPTLSQIADIIYDPELVSPLQIAAYIPRWAEDARLRVDYSKDLVDVVGVRYPSPSPSETARVVITATGYRFTTESSWLGLTSIPWIETITEDHGATAIRQAPDPANPNEVIADEAWIISRIDLPDGGSQRWVGADTPTARSYTMQFEDLLTTSPSDYAYVTVLVNGTAQHTDVDIDTVRSVMLDLEPGENTVTVIAGDSSDVCHSTGTSTCFEVTLPDAINADRSKGLFLNAGDSYDLTVYTPPVLR